MGINTAPSRLDEVEEETPAQVPEPSGTEDIFPRGEETIEAVVNVDAKIGLEARREGGGAPKNLLGVTEIGDSLLFPSFSQSMICDAQAVETCHGEGAYREEDPFRGYFVGVEDVTGVSDLEASKKSSGEVGVSCLFNEVQQALNRASALYHKAFFRSRGELNRYEAKNRRLTEQRDTFKLLNEQREEEAKGLRAELEASREEQTDLAEQVKQIFEVNITDSGMVANSSIPMIQRKLDVIGKLREEVDTVKVDAEAWKKNMDRLASEKEVVQAQLASAETQLRSLKEKALVQAKKIEEFQSQLGLATSDREKLATELAAAKSDVETTKANADAMVTVYRSDSEAAHVRAKEVAEADQDRANWVAEHAKCQSRRETLEEIHARDFDFTVEIQNAKELEAEAGVWPFLKMMIPGV
ncbi:uncharacterized protein [Nicotiana tomentosiformis]|uniref:uncharacterized protein n=1 Tax=Nicotiana tomentosiformis TaxID=4098 RepID=UPI00388CA32E